MIALYRFLAILITFVCYSVLDEVTFLRVLSGIGLSHYLLALYFSRYLYKKNFIDVFKSSVGMGLVMGMILIASIYLGVINFPSIALLFGLHHVLSETYVLQMTGISDKVIAKTFYLRAFINTSVYFIILSPLALNLHRGFLLAYAGGLLAALAYLSWSASSDEKKSALQVCLFEALGLLLFAVYVPQKLNFSILVFYHFVIWWMIPFLKGKTASAMKQLLLQWGLGVIIFILTPRIGIESIPTLRTHGQWTIFLGYFHIITTFFVSQLNPKFIQRWTTQKRAT